MSYKYDLSIIVPVYNAEKTLEEMLESIIPQKDDGVNFEIILVNDGSKDDSRTICEKYKKENDFIKYFEQENSGVSKTRNKGLDEAEGTYIMFVDSDDKLAPKTIRGIFKHFSENDKWADLLAYPLYSYKDGKVKKHPRSKNYAKARVVNLEKEPYFDQVTMNIVIKNKKEKIYFDENFKQSEDALFITRHLLDKKKIIVSNVGGYHYRTGEYSTVKKYKLASKIGDQTLCLFERYIKDYTNERGKVPKYIQSMILYELNWRFKSSFLFPTYLNEADYQKWFGRLENILSFIEDEVLMKHNRMDYYHKIHFAKIKAKNGIRINYNKNDISFYNEDNLITEIKNFTLVFHKVKAENDTLKLLLTVKAPFLELMKNLKIKIKKNGKDYQTEELNKLSNESYYKNKTRTNTFYLHECELPIEIGNEYSFFIEVDGSEYTTESYMMREVDFQTEVGFQHLKHNKKHVFFRKSPFTITVIKRKVKHEIKEAKNSLENKYVKIELYKKIVMGKKKRVWLYNDRINVFDNAYQQFLYDLEKKDGVERYYLTYKKENIDGKFTEKQKKHLVVYGSKEHKKLLANAEYVLTTFQAHVEYIPYTKRAYSVLKDKLNYKVIYLQHGILHAHTPWIYAKEKTSVDYFLTSSPFEKEILTTKYNYKESDLIQLKMARFAEKKKVEKNNKILYAPSWRIYFTNGMKGIEWQMDDGALLDSDYYNNNVKLLNDKKLEKMLKENNLTLEFNLHPIFKPFAKYFEEAINNPYVKIVDVVDDVAMYNAFITDFSSYIYDYVYQEIPVLFFIPDRDDFLSGNHIYRKLELDVEKLFGRINTTSEEIIEDIETLIKQKFEIPKQYKKNYLGFFNDVENPMEELYKKLYKKELK